MGEQLQKVSMKWSAATLQHEAELLDAFAGLVEGRSQLSRVTMKIAWRLVRTVGILRVIEEFVQDKPCETAPDLVAPSLTESSPAQAFPIEGRAKPLRRIIASEGIGASRREVRGVNRRLLLDGSVVLLESYSPSFQGVSVRPLGKVLLFKSNSFRQVA